MQKSVSFHTWREELRELGKYKNPLKIPIPLWKGLLIAFMGLEFAIFGIYLIYTLCDTY